MSRFLPERKLPCPACGRDDALIGSKADSPLRCVFCNQELPRDQLNPESALERARAAVAAVKRKRGH